jgi:hypothetical protein
MSWLALNAGVDSSSKYHCLNNRNSFPFKYGNYCVVEKKQGLHCHTRPAPPKRSSGVDVQNIRMSISSGLT